MKTLLKVKLLIFLTLILFMNCAEKQKIILIQAKNELNFERVNELIDISFKDLLELNSEIDKKNLLIIDNTNGDTLVYQKIDDNKDGVIDRLLIQVDFKPKEEKTLSVSNNDHKLNFKSKVYGRYVPERKDDFAWENDRIAFRMYGPALEEELVSSGIDVWVKKVDYLVIDNWYKAGDDAYHHDRGEGLDFYSVGPSRGCGGVAVLDDGELFPSSNFSKWEIIANGPLSLIFELSYEPWDADGIEISEKKRIALNAGSNLNLIESTFKYTSDSAFNIAIGLAKHKNKETELIEDIENNCLIIWEQYEKHGGLGLCIKANDENNEFIEQNDHYLIVERLPQNGIINYYAGACWEKSSLFDSLEDWKKYINEFIQRQNSPINIDLLQK